MTFPLAIDLSSVTSQTFVVGVLVVAGIYALVALGLQLNVGYTGISNFGAAAFMAIGAYTMAVLVVKAGFSFWLAFPLAIGAAVLFGVLIGLPSLRLRADYFAIATLAMAEVVRLFAQNARDLTGGNQGLFCDLSGGHGCYTDTWNNIANSINDFLGNLGWSGSSTGSGAASWDGPNSLFPLLIVVWVAVILVTLRWSTSHARPGGGCCVQSARTRTRRGRWARTRSPTSFSRWRSQERSGPSRACSTRSSDHGPPMDFQPLFTFFAFGVLILGGLTSYWGVPTGSDPSDADNRGQPLRRPRALRAEGGLAPLRPDRVDSHSPDGVQATGHVRQARGDGPR